MAIEVGTKVTGKVSGITNFGAFVNLGNNQTGLVHISEVSDGFVKDIHDVLSVGDDVTVKVLSVGDDGKIGLSICKAVDKPQGEHEHHGNHQVATGQTIIKVTTMVMVNVKAMAIITIGQIISIVGEMAAVVTITKYEPKKQDFDSLMSGFLKDSEDRLATLKRNTEGKVVAVVVVVAKLSDLPLI